MLQSIPIKSTVRSLILLFNFLLLAIVGYSQAPNYDWIPKYNTIKGDETSSGLGDAVAVSGDGTVFAYNVRSSNEFIRIFKLTGSDTLSLGRITTSSTRPEYIGESIALNYDGSRLIYGGRVSISGNQYGMVQVHEFSEADSSWNRMGSEIRSNKTPESKRLGYRTAISASGDTIAISDPGHEANQNLAQYSHLGFVQVFTWSGSKWVQLGENIESPNTGGKDFFGSDIDLSANGSRIVIGDKMGEQSSNSSNLIGSASVYEFNNGSWQLLGNRVYGDVINEYFGGSVDMTPDGSKIVVGSSVADVYAPEQPEGVVKVFEYSTNSWVQVGSTLTGYVNFTMGYESNISADGGMITVSMHKAGPVTDPIDVGYIREYRFDSSTSDWSTGPTRGGASSNTLFGTMLDMDDVGKIIVAGDTRNDEVTLHEYLNKIPQIQTVGPGNGLSTPFPVVLEWKNDYPNSAFMSTDLHVSNLADFSDTLIYVDNGFTNSDARLVQFDSMSLFYPEEQYYWRVKHNYVQLEYFDGIDSDWTNSSFTVAPVEVPAILSEDGQTYEPAFTLNWENENQPNVFQFNFQLSTQSDYSDTIIYHADYADSLFTFNETDTLEQGTYYWRLRRQPISLEDTYSEWNNQSFSILIDGVSLLSPEDASVQELPFTFLWSSDSLENDDYGYDFQLSTTSDFQDTLLLNMAVADTSFLINQSDSLLLGTEYFWRARRRAYENATYASSWEQASVSFETQGVTPLNPEDGNTIELPATLAWQPESDNTEDYDLEVQISLSESFADTLLYEEGVQDTTLIVDFDFERELGETYFWRARRVGTENSTYASEWSTIQSFSTKIDAPEVEGPQGDTIELSYNFTWLPDTLDAFYNYNLVIYSDEELSDSLTVYTINNGTSQVISPSDGESGFLFRSDSTYYWNLARFANQNNSLRSEPTPTYSFRTKVDNATILSPTMGDTINPAFTGFTWDQSNLENIENYVYEMRIADTIDFTDPILIDGPINGSNHSPEVIFQADTSKLYYWGIRRFANGNDFLISDFAVDSVVFQINAPELVGPEEGTDIILGQTPVTLQWFDATGGDPNLDYYLQVSEFRNFSNPIVDQEVEGGFFTLDNNDLETNETYYWRVRVAWNQGGIAPEFHMSSRWSTSSFFVYPDYIRLIPDSVFVVEPNYVNVMLHALDGENEGITVLEQDDFELLENDSPISPTESRYQVSKLDQIPSNLQTVLMLDNSLSIGEDNLDSIKNAARSFIRNKAEDQEISIFVFADMVENVIDFSTDTTALLSAIDNIVLTQFSGTDLYSATLTGLAAMENKFSLTQIQQSFMLLFTDGKDLAGRATLDSVVNARGNKQIYAVGVKLNEADFDEPTLRQIGNAATFVDEGFSELIGRFEEVQENSLLFANSFYWLNYASSRRAGLTDLTAQMVENTNVNEDRRIVTTFDADGFYSAPIDIVVDGSAEAPLGVDTIRIAGDATQKVKIESVFAYAAYPFSFEISDPTRLQVVPDIENPFNYDFHADGEAEDTVRLTIVDTVQQTLNLEKTLIIIYSERETSFNEAPEIENQTFSLEENSEAGILVGTIVATDPEGDPLTYAILSGNEGGAFSLDESSGELTVANEAAIDFETTPTFILTIEVTDTEPKSNTAEITVNLTDVFENQEPVFEAQNFTVNEHSPIGTVVGELEASDAENDELTFTIESGNESGLFALDNASRTITVANSENLDFEVVQQVILQVIVSDGDLSTEAAITIDLIDVDENTNQPPAINDQQFSILLSSTTGEIIGTVNASDPNGDELTFSILNGNDEGIFTIDVNNGELSILDATNLAETSYTLTVDVSDGELNSSASITIDVTDENFAPEINDQSFTISESATNGNQVGTVIASDPNNDNLVFSIDDGNTNGIFVINSSTGIISISNESALSVSEFSLTVSVFDGELSAEATIKINVVEVNDPPTVDDQAFTIDENSAASTTVGTISTSDPENDPLIFSIVSGNETGSFEIGENTGILSVLSSSALDFETTTTFTLGIEVSDGLNTVSATITINLNDVEDSGQLPPQIENQAFSVDENSPNGTVIGTVVATDPENNTIFFGIVSGNENGEFGIGLNDGVLTVENSNGLDYEVNPVFDLVVEAGDGDKLNTAIITINLNDLDDNDPPQIENQTFSLEENSENGTVVGAVVASDPDGDAISYSITDGNVNGAFAIDISNGNISVTNTSELDFEINPTFNLEVEVTDGSLSASASITINLTNVSENTAPEISDQTFTIDENSASGTQVGTVIATDAENDALSFSIVSGNDLNGFTIDMNTGELAVATSTALDYETTPVFSLEVEVSDSEQSASAIVTVNLNNLDEGSNTAPEISDQSFTVIENSAVGTVVGNVQANDEDGDVLTFGINAGNTEGIFEVDTNDGTIKVASNESLSLDQLDNPTINLIVFVSDGVETSAALVSITVESENPLSIDNEELVSVYPNPFKDKLYLKLKMPAAISISDLSGKIILESTYPKGDHDMILSNIPSGVYQVSIHFDDGSFRIIKTVMEE